MLRLRIRIMLVALLALAGPSATLAQYDLSWWTVDGGGQMFSTAARFRSAARSASPTPMRL